MSDQESPDTPGQPELRAMLPAVVAVYAVIAAAGWLWLSLRGRADVASSLAIGAHGPVVAAGAGLLVAGVLLAAVSLLVRYVPVFAGLDRRLAALIGPLSDNQMLVVSLASGIGEEFFFRCAMQDLLGVWLTAACFGLAHVGGGPALRWWAPTACLFGLAMGCLVAAGFGVLSAAVAHALFNYFSLRRLCR